MRLPVNHALPLVALILLGASPVFAGKSRPPMPAVPANGPAADYPVVIGDPFTVDGQTWTPADTLNYDQVGHAAVAGEGTGVTGAHRTLPLPSYVEVTSLESGRTILVRLTARGPMRNDRLVELSPAAAAQLGLAGDSAPVRMRRVNPPEPERALLRAGGEAPARMDTPQSLLAVLMRKLTGAPAPRPVAKPVDPAAAAPATVSPAAAPGPAAAKAAPPLPETPAKPAATPAARGSIIVQIAAFSTKERADAAAKRLGARIIPAGRLWRMQLGPYASAAEAAAGLAKARAAGYPDARIVRPR